MLISNRLGLLFGYNGLRREGSTALDGISGRGGI